LFARRQADGDEIGFSGDAGERLGVALDAIGGGIVLADWQGDHNLKRTRGSRHGWEPPVEVDSLPDHEFTEGHDLTASLAFWSERVRKAPSPRQRLYVLRLPHQRLRTNVVGYALAKRNPLARTPRTVSRTPGSKPLQPCQYIRGQGGYGLLARRRSGGLQIVRRRFSGPSIGDNLIRDLLSLVEAVHPSALDGADVHENILAAIIGLDEAKAFLAVEPLYGPLRHETFLSGTCLDEPHSRAAGS